MARKFTVHPKTVAAATDTTRLYVEFYPYERYGIGAAPGRKSATVSDRSLLGALKKLVDRMQLYIDSDDIDLEGWTAEDVIRQIDMSNGDGCDHIVILKNLDTDEVLISGFDEMEEAEDWDDDEDDIESSTKVTAATKHSVAEISTALLDAYVKDGEELGLTEDDYEDCPFYNDSNGYRTDLAKAIAAVPAVQEANLLKYAFGNDESLDVTVYADYEWACTFLTEHRSGAGHRIMQVDRNGKFIN